MKADSFHDVSISFSRIHFTMALSDLADKAQENLQDKSNHVEGEAVQVVLPKGDNGQKTLVRVRSDCVQIGDYSEIVNMTFETNHRAVADFLSADSTGSDKGRTIVRVLPTCAENETSAGTETRDISEERALHIRCKLVQIIANCQTPTMELKVTGATRSAQIGNGNRLLLPITTTTQSEKPTQPEGDRSCLRIIRKPKSPVPGRRHYIGLVYSPLPSANLEVHVTCPTRDTGQGVADSILASRWGEEEFRPEEGSAKFWFYFYRPKTTYTVKFSLVCPNSRETGGLEVEREILGTASVSLQTCAKKTQRREQKAKSRKLPPSKLRSQERVSQDITTVTLSLAEATQLCGRFEKIMQVLLPLRDDGQWRKFDDTASALLREHSDPGTRAVILLEQAVAASFRNENERAEEIFGAAWEDVRCAPVTLARLLRGRALCYLAGIRRRAGKLAGAEELLESPRRILEGSACILDLALLAYEEGSLQLCFLESSSLALKQSIFNKATKQFDKFFELRQRMKTSEQHIYNMKVQFAVMKKAMVLLRSSTRRYRDKLVDETSICQATALLDSIREHMRLKIAQAQFCLVRADQFVRQHCYEAAESFSLEAWDLSHACGSDIVEIASEQLSYIRRVRSQPKMQRQS